MKNKITFLILFIVLGFCSLQAQVTQEWVQIYTGPFDDKASSIAVDDSENVYVSGRSYRSGTGHNCATIKYNSSGVQQWGQSHNGFGTGFYGPTSLEVDNSGNVYITGSSAESGTYPDYTTIKYNSSGVQTWIQSYNGPGNSYDGAHSLAVDGSGNVYVTGHSPGIGTNNDYATIKYSSSGDQQWVQRYNGPGNLGDYANSLAVDDSGNVYVTGSSGNGINSDYATIKYNSSGVQQWVQRYNGTGNNHNAAHSIAVDYSGNVYVTGKSDSYPHTVYATIKYNSSGVQQWIQEYGPINNVENAPPSLAVDGSGNAYITGNSVGSGTSADYATVKYNSSGVQQWVQLYNGPGNGDDGATSLAVDISGNVFVTGGSIGSGSSYDYATIKYNSSGVQQWVQTYIGNNYDIASSLALDGSGNVYVTGGSIGSGTSYDYATIKYSQTDDISAPSNLEAQSVDSSFIKVTWQDNSNDEDGFYIERTKINDSTHWEVIDEVPQNVNQYSDYFVTRGLKYYYRAKAHSGNLFSEYSNIDSATLGGNAFLIPAPPSNLMLLNRTGSTLQMGWHDNSGNENGFIIFRKTEGDLFFEIIDSVHTDVVTYQEVGVNSNLNYSYRICSYNSSGISDFSNTLTVFSKSAPDIKTSEFAGNYILYENYPNPFNPVTNLEIGISKLGFVSLKIYNVLGKEVATLVNNILNPGIYKYNFDASALSSGVYFYKLVVDGNIIDTKRMVLLK